MYNTNPVRIDIAGTVESISHITKEYLYTCYNTFYSPQNMFIVVVGDVDVDLTINLIEKNIKLYEKDYDKNNKIDKIETFSQEEIKDIAKKEIEQKMDIYMPQLCIGYKLNIVTESEIVKRSLVCDIISDLYFSKITPFFEKEYEKGILSDVPTFGYEGTATFAHAILFASSTNIDKLKFDLCEYLEEIKQQDIDTEMFELIKKKKIGELIRRADNLNISYRRIIESSLNSFDIYEDVKILKDLNKEDIKQFLNLLDVSKQVISIIREK